MEKFLLTGFSGFVSKHFLEYLESLGSNVAVIGIDINPPEFDYAHFQYVKCSFIKIDLLDKNQVDNIIYIFQPQYILHLASFSSVAYSWKNPVASFSNNTNIFLNLLEQIRSLNLGCRIISVGSSEEYGNVDEADIPLKEDHNLKPVSPYAVARVSQEMLSKIYVEGYGQDVVLTRSFNHIGPGQRDIFVVSSFAKRLVEIKKYNKPGKLTTGDLSIIRDFVDVRDVVKAYYLLFKSGKKGEVYNICSGAGVSLESIISKMAGLLGIDVTTNVDNGLIRPSDNKIIVGDNTKIKTEVGWKPGYKLENSLKDIIDYWYTIV
jgi:GDP-4-dehydro-6-deoxy-D-mannose reductase